MLTASLYCRGRNGRRRLWLTGIPSITPPTTQAELEISIVAAQPTGGANLVCVFLVLSVHILDSEGKGIALDRAVPGEK